MNIQNSYCDNLINVNYTRSERPDKNSFALHTHEMCELYCFLGGKGQFKIEGNSYPLTVGDVLIMRRGEAHYIDINPDFPYTRISVHFDEGLFDSFDSRRALLTPFAARERGRLNLYSADELDGNCCRSFTESMSADKLDRLSVVSRLIPVLADICRAFDGKSNPIEEETAIQKVIKYINNNLSEHISLDEICREFYISKPQLCRLFKANTGSTVWEYITAKRLILAESYIRAGHSPTKIFADCGFGDYSTFFRAYKKRYNRSPNEQR